jgi:hypothetical protein
MVKLISKDKETPCLYTISLHLKRDGPTCLHIHTQMVKLKFHHSFHKSTLTICLTPYEQEWLVHQKNYETPKPCYGAPSNPMRITLIQNNGNL